MNFKRPGIFIVGMLISAFQPLHAADPEQAPCVASRQASDPGKESTPASEEQLFESSYAEAECLRKAAAEKNAEWLKTGEILLLSRQKAENGNLEMAIQLLQTARFQAETAIKQADLEAHAWKHRVIGYRKTEE